MCTFGVESINITSLSPARACSSRSIYMLYDDELYRLKANKIYVMYEMLCLSSHIYDKGVGLYSKMCVILNITAQNT